MKKSSLKTYIFLTLITSIAWIGGSWWHYACNIKNTCSDNTLVTNTDGLNNVDSNNKVSNIISSVDTDGDGLSDDEESILGTDPLLLDTDQDSISDSQEVGVNLESPRDSDEDGLIDALDFDDDNDGLATIEEEKVGTSSLHADTDEDSILDSIEVGDDSTKPLDTDGDGIINALDTDDDDDSIDTIQEALLGTNPLLIDSDGDGIPDNIEIGGNSDKPQDTNKNGVFDALETDVILDQDNDGLSDSIETLLNTDPTKSDSDGDGVMDGIEVGDNPKQPLDQDLDGIIDALDSTDNTDTDNDGISDTQEALLKSNPELADSDDDGINDSEELGKDPAKPLDTDNDGLLNLVDRDDDNDNLSTRYETRIGTNPLSTDSDNDGLPDFIEVKLPNSDELQDTDNDKLINPIDTDDDNDTIPTVDELTLGTDPLKVDSDDDGIADAVEVGSDYQAANDTDKDGLIDALDTKDNPIVTVASDTNNSSTDTKPDSTPSTDDTDTNETKAIAKEISIELIGTIGENSIQSSILYFPYLSADPVIKDDALEYLDTVADWMKKDSENRIELIGHTDNIGTARANLALGIKRVMVIRELLIDRGTPFAQIEVMSKGESRPINSNNTKVGRTKNRRVEITPLSK